MTGTGWLGALSVACVVFWYYQWQQWRAIERLARLGGALETKVGFLEQKVLALELELSNRGPQ